MSADMSEIAVPDVAESLLGFRCWRWDPASLTLWSVTQGDAPKRQPRTRELLATPKGAWPYAAPLDAMCNKRGKDGRGHAAPDPDCSCGVYATYRVPVVADYLPDAPVLGLVQGYGRTVPADDGFRAEHVRIACLFAVAEDFTIPRRDLDWLGSRYGVPVVVPHSDRPEDYRHGVRSGFAGGWQLDFTAGSP